MRVGSRYATAGRLTGGTLSVQPVLEEPGLKKAGTLAGDRVHKKNTTVYFLSGPGSLYLVVIWIVCDSSEARYLCARLRTKKPTFASSVI